MKLRKKEFLTICILLVGLIQVEAQEGTFDVTGDITMSSSATYESHIKDLSGAGTGHDQIASSGDLTLDGTLDIVLDGYSPSVSDHFELMTYGGALTGTFATINWPADMTSQGWMIDYGIITAGKVTIYGSSSALPVELVNFDVIIRDGDHIVRWQTASEVNCDYFDIEHSLSGLSFEPIGRVESQGNSLSLESYKWNHTNPTAGVHYYRLKQVDKDGKFEYSQIRSINKDRETNAISYYPNPAKEEIHFSESVTHVSICSLSGQLMLERQSVGKTLNISSLPSGSYMVTINKSIKSTKLIIQ